MSLVLIICGFAGFLFGRLSAGWSAIMLHDMNHGGLMTCCQCGKSISWFQRWLAVPKSSCRACQNSQLWPGQSAICLAILFAIYAYCLLDPTIRCQSIAEVQPSGSLISGRLPFHLCLIFLMWTATVTDFLDYMIPDPIILTGIVIAVLSATVSGELQMIHIWVDWDRINVDLYGPGLPAWMDQHRHLHGLAWSLAGMATGAIVTATVRFFAGKILGAPAMGGGDVTFMAMIGAFVGWQPTLCILAGAPLAGIVVGLACRIATGRSFVAFGPYLAFSTFVVLCTWRFLWADWLRLRDIFSHWPTVLGLLVGAIGGMCGLLILLRIFRNLPANRITRM